MNHFLLGWCYFLLCKWLVLCSTVSTFVEDKALEPVEQLRCLKPMPIQIPECQNTFYKFTGMPNLVGQETQFDARHQLQTFKPLITYKCSNKLSFFLCSVYTPMCDANTRHLIGPCRPLCEHVKARCAPVLRVFDIDWPATLNCSRFPVKNVVGGTMCMEGPQDSEETPLFSEAGDVTTHDEAVKGRASPSKMVGAVENKIPTPGPNLLGRKPGVEEDEQLVSSWIQQFSEFQLTNENNGPRAPHPNRQASAISVMAQTLRHCAFLKKSTSYVYINRTGRCAPLCQAHILFHPDAKTLSIIWTSVLSGICSLLTSVTLVGYLIHSSLFRLTERPVIYITLCQLIYSLGFALSIGLGRETVTCGPDLDSGREIRLQEGLDNSVCALVFMVQYFFAIASSMWWSLLTIHWALQYSYCWCSLCWEPVDSSEDYTSVARSDIECWPHLNELCCCMPRNSWDKENAVDVIGSQVDNDPSETVNPTNSVFTQSNAVREVNNTSRIGSGATQTVFDPSSKMFPPPQVPGSETVCYFAQNGKIIPSCRYITTATTTTIIANQSRFHRTINSGNFEQIAVFLAREHVLVWLTAGLLTVGVLVSRQNPRAACVWSSKKNIYLILTHKSGQIVKTSYTVLALTVTSYPKRPAVFMLRRANCVLNGAAAKTSMTLTGYFGILKINDGLTDGRIALCSSDHISHQTQMPTKKRKLVYVFLHDDLLVFFIQHSYEVECWAEPRLQPEHIGLSQIGVDLRGVPHHTHIFPKESLFQVHDRTSSAAAVRILENLLTTVMKGQDQAKVMHTTVQYVLRLQKHGNQINKCVVNRDPIRGFLSTATGPLDSCAKSENLSSTERQLAWLSQQTIHEPEHRIDGLHAYLINTVTRLLGKKQDSNGPRNFCCLIGVLQSVVGTIAVYVTQL
ncbi:fz domain protein [Opisthorchis viverrini]|uniref:Fz domain protein n=1 Tax=Opisthorchis viverrini TaxID=6198 RepID=A0A1S8XB73_OPIVI|nr:fz domain protein [Opisthorchis viverrini]